MTTVILLSLKTLMPLQNGVVTYFRSTPLLSPANEVCEGYVFTSVCLSTWGGHAWFYLVGGMHGFIRGEWVVLFGGHAWFYLGGVRGFIWGGVCGFIRGGMRGFFSFYGYNEIRSMSGWYASYWNAFLFSIRRVLPSNSIELLQHWLWRSMETDP